MLSLFKLPFWDRNHQSENCLPLKNINFDIWKNFISRGENVSAEQSHRGLELMDANRKSLQRSLKDKPPHEHYEMMLQYLRNLDNELQSL